MSLDPEGGGGGHSDKLVMILTLKLKCQLRSPMQLNWEIGKMKCLRKRNNRDFLYYFLSINVQCSSTAFQIKTGFRK